MNGVREAEKWLLRGFAYPVKHIKSLCAFWVYKSMKYLNIENFINIYRWDVRKCEATVSLRNENICITSCYVKNVQIPFSFWSLFHRNHKQDIQAVTVLIRNERRQLKGDEAFSQ